MNKLLFLITAIVMSLLVAVGAAFAFAPEPHVHEYKSEITKDATCAFEGEITFTCDCDDYYIEKIPALGHTEEAVEGREATCIETGLTAGTKCTTCGEAVVKQESIPALGHDVVHFEAVDPTCIEIGLTAGESCTRCDYTVTRETIPALGHDMVTDEAVEPNCNDTGLTEGSHCTRCDHKVEQEVVPALGHDVKIIASVRPTCTETGLRQGYYCARCDGYNIKQDVVPALGHAYDDIYDETCNTCGHVRDAVCRHTNKVAVGEAKEPTCTEAGITEGVKCSECDEILEPQEIKEKLGHDPVNHEAKAPTCTEIGWDAYETCSRCDYTTYVEIAALGHNHQPAVTEPTCTEIGYTTYTCSACGDNYRVDEVAALGHNYGAWSLATEPTYATAGALSKTCGTCSHVDTKNIGVVSADNGYTLVITGVLSRWQYALDGQTFTFDITETIDTTDGKNTYSDDASAWYVGVADNGSLIYLDGYKHTNAAWDGTNRSFGGRNKTYTTTIVAPKDTTVTLVLNCARNKVKPFFNDGVEWVLNWIKVNGSEDGVIYDTTSTLNKTGWHNYNNYAIATIFLKEGKNVISLQSSTTVNIKGIGFISSETIHIHTDVIDNAVAPTCLASGLTQGIHCSECNKVIVAQETITANGAHTFETYSMITTPDYTSEGKLVKKCTLCGVADEESVVVLPKISEENGYVKVSSTDTEEKWQYTYAEQTFDIVISTTFGFVAFVNDPFIAENGGSISGTISVSNDVPRYQNTRGQTFTATITVSSDTVADFIIKVENGSKTNTYAGLFSSITLDGVAVTINDGSVTGQGWGRSIDIVVASLNLTKGTHVITFTRTTDGASNNNFNIWGIGFITSDSVSITLGSEE